MLLAFNTLSYIGIANVSFKFLLTLPKEHTYMKNGYIFKTRALPVCIVLVLTMVCSVSSDGADIPHLEKQGTATQLIVDGRPYLILGGELGNSSSSSLEYMEPIWSRLVKLNLNTVLAPVY